MIERDREPWESDPEPDRRPGREPHREPQEQSDREPHREPYGAPQREPVGEPNKRRDSASHRQPRDLELDRFSQEANAFMDLNETKEVMVREARSVLSKHPEADPVGLLFQRDAPLAKGVLTALEKATGQILHAKGFLGVMPRSLANEILKHEDPNLLAQLAHAPGGRGPSRRLPIICMTRSGARMMVVGYEAPQPWEGEL